MVIAKIQPFVLDPAKVSEPTPTFPARSRRLHSFVRRTLNPLPKRHPRSLLTGTCRLLHGPRYRRIIAFADNDQRHEQNPSTS